MSNSISNKAIGTLYKNIGHMTNYKKLFKKSFHHNDNHFKLHLCHFKNKTTFDQSKRKPFGDIYHTLLKRL